MVDNLTVVNGDCGGGMMLMAQSLSFCVGVLVVVLVVKNLIVVCDAGCGAAELLWWWWWWWQVQLSHRAAASTALARYS